MESADNSTWEIVRDGLVRIYSHQSRMDTDCFIKLYTSIFKYCTNQRSIKASREQRRVFGDANRETEFIIGGGLYRRLQNFIEGIVEEFSEELNELRNEDLLERYIALWSRFQFSSTVADKILLYMNRHWTNREADRTTSTTQTYAAYDLAVLTWRTGLFDKLQNDLTSATLSLIERDRNGEKITTTLLSGIISSYMEMDCHERQDLGEYKVYKKYFEVPFLQSTADYYTKESTGYLESHKVIEYINRVEQRLKEEDDRRELYFPQTGKDLLDAVLHNVLVARHTDIFHEDFKRLLKEECEDDAARFYNLYVHAGAKLDKLQSVFGCHVESVGRMAIQHVVEAKDPRQYVNVISKTHAYFRNFVAKAFKSHTGFFQEMDIAFVSFLNANQATTDAGTIYNPPELLAKCCDLFLRKGPKNPEENELDQLLNQVMLAFKYFKDKDVFQNFYSKMLARRLVNDLSASDAGELSMISKLRQMCGFEYTRKLQKMFTDSGISRDISESFKQSQASENCIDTSIMVLTTGAWPVLSHVTFRVPPELDYTMKTFREFYTSRHSGRILNYLLISSRGEIAANFSGGKRYSFIATVAQMSVLDMFNASVTHSFEHICSYLEMKPELVTAILQSIIKIELLNTTQGDLKDGDAVFALNEKFSNKKVRIDLTKMIAKAEAHKEIEQVQQEIEDDRRHVIQAAIVRVMKSRKRLKHTLLVGEVIGQLTNQFTPKIQTIKKSIETLIDREYMKRNEKDHETLDYIS